MTRVYTTHIIIFSAQYTKFQFKGKFQFKQLFLVTEKLFKSVVDCTMYVGGGHGRIQCMCYVPSCYVVHIY